MDFVDFEDIMDSTVDFEPGIFNHTGHKELWNYLAENPTEWKEDWPGWEVNGGEYSKVDSNCFACEFTIGGTCHDCPLIWPSGCCTGYCGLYKKWAEVGISLEERTSLALKIANLPIRNGIKTI